MSSGRTLRLQFCESPPFCRRELTYSWSLLRLFSPLRKLELGYPESVLLRTTAPTPPPSPPPLPSPLPSPPAAPLTEL